MAYGAYGRIAVEDLPTVGVQLAWRRNSSAFAWAKHHTATHRIWCGVKGPDDQGTNCTAKLFNQRSLQTQQQLGDGSSTGRHWCAGRSRDRCSSSSSWLWITPAAAAAAARLLSPPSSRRAELSDRENTSRHRASRVRDEMNLMQMFQPPSTTNIRSSNICPPDSCLWLRLRLRVTVRG